MPALDASKLESLIVDRICSLDYVARAAYGDDGREVTVMVVHDYDPARDSLMVREIGDMGTEIEDETPGRVVVTLAIDDGPDLPGDMFIGHKIVYARNAGH